MFNFIVFLVQKTLKDNMLSHFKYHKTKKWNGTIFLKHQKMSLA